jgi:hypothetical protein
MNKRERKVRRILHREHTKILGGKGKADKLRREAADLRYRHDLCRCSDDERYYPSHEAADKDKTPAAICADCGKKKLLNKIIGTGAPLPEGIDPMTALTRLLR